MNDSLLFDLIRGLDLFGVERMPDSSFSALSPPPAWLAPILRDVPDAPRTLGQAFPFLDNFLTDAERFWRAGVEQCLRSAPFTATVPAGELLLRATALNLGAHRVLVLERLTGDADTRPVLQKARENKLLQERLARQVADVRKPVASIARLAGELLETELTAAQRELAEAMGREIERVRRSVE